MRGLGEIIFLAYPKGSREGNSLLTEPDIVYFPKGIHPRFAWFLTMGLKNAIETVFTLFVD